MTAVRQMEPSARRTRFCEVLQQPGSSVELHMASHTHRISDEEADLGHQLVTSCQMRRQGMASTTGELAQLAGKVGILLGLRRWQITSRAFATRGSP